MRSYVRYPYGLPVSVSLEEVAASERLYLNNISCSGLLLNSMVVLKVGTVIRLRIPPRTGRCSRFLGRLYGARKCHCST